MLRQEDEIFEGSLHYRPTLKKEKIEVVTLCGIMISGVWEWGSYKAKGGWISGLINTCCMHVLDYAYTALH